jgi:Transglycosylase SLT domain
MGKQFRMDVPVGELQEILDDLKLEPQFKVVSRDERDGIVVLIVENTSVPAPPPPPPAADEDPPPPPPPAGTIKAKPGPNQSVVDAIIAGAVAQGLDPMTVLTIVAIESMFNPTICNRSTSAAGLFQFIDKTWATASGGLTFPGRGGKNNGQAAGASVPVQVKIGCKFLQGISSRLQQALGHTPSATEIYILHQQGDGGGMKILKGDKNAPITSVISADAARLNGFAGMTIGQTIAAFGKLVARKAAAAQAQVV